MRIKKVKLTSDKKILIIYEKKPNTGAKDYDEYSLSCSEEARPEFYKSMERLALHVVKMCELPQEYIDRIVVKGVTFSYAGQAEVMGATITAQMKLEESYQNLNLNTPYKASGSYSEAPADPKQILDFRCIADLKYLQSECELYINGDRSQGRLFNTETLNQVAATTLN
jgi:hypothetical protein